MEYKGIFFGRGIQRVFWSWDTKGFFGRGIQRDFFGRGIQRDFFWPWTWPWGSLIWESILVFKAFFSMNKKIVSNVVITPPLRAGLGP